MLLYAAKKHRGCNHPGRGVLLQEIEETGAVVTRPFAYESSFLYGNAIP
jgi:hypothetical protein